MQESAGRASELGRWQRREPGGSKASVLVVDDESSVLRAMRRILSGEGYEVVLSHASDVEAQLRDATPDVVLLDLCMGDVDGFDVLQSIKRWQPSTEVVMMTGNGSIESAVGCMRQGAFDYLTKPFVDVRAVRSTVRQAVEHRRRQLASGRAAEAGGCPRSSELEAELPLSLEAYEKSVLERALRQSGDASEAAKHLGIGRSTFYRKLAKHRIQGSPSDGTAPRRAAIGVGPR